MLTHHHTAQEHYTSPALPEAGKQPKSMDTSNMFCSICGCVFVHKSNAALVRGLPTSLQCDAVLLSDTAQEFERLELHYRAGKPRGTALTQPIDFESDGVGLRDVDGAAVREEPATYTGYDRFQLETMRGEGGDDDDDGQMIRVNDHIGQEAWEGENSTYRIAVHPACLDVAKDFVKAQERRRGSFGAANGEGVAHIGSLRTLWKALRMRWDALDAMVMVSDGSLGDSPYAALKRHPVYQQPGPGEVGVLLQRQWDPSEQADPVSITSVVIGVARSLETISADADPIGVEQFRHRFYDLPRELQEIILGFMATQNGGWAPQSNRMLSRSTWRHLLLDGRTLPFLGQLDHDVFAKEDRIRELDCETIIRKLSQSPSPRTGYWHELGDSVPHWLRSRRWRWELLDKMYVGDVLPTWYEWMQRESDVPAIPRYWDRNGNRVYPVTRMTECS